MITQMVIAGSGYGTRMSETINIRHTKSLIVVSGRHLIDIQLSWAISGGIKNFCISVKPEDRNVIEGICSKYKANFIFRTGEKTFQEVPSLFLDVLDDRFIFVGGHTPILPTHIEKMINAARYYRYIVSSYDNKYNAIPKKERIIVNRDISSEGYALVYNKDHLPENHFYLKNPYIIDRGIVNSVRDGFFIKTPLFYIFKEWENGASVISVNNEFPVEFNTDDEFIRTKKFLDKHLLEPWN